MVQLTSAVLVAVAAFAGQALAITQCVPGQFYCGYNLLNSPSAIAAWKTKIDAALAERGLPADGEHENNSLFWCRTADTIVLDEYCFVAGNPQYRCQPPSANGCGAGSTSNDCCATPF